jgi:hypothetical protein
VCRQTRFGRNALDAFMGKPDKSELFDKKMSRTSDEEKG